MGVGDEPLQPVEEQGEELLHKLMGLLNLVGGIVDVAEERVDRDEELASQELGQLVGRVEALKLLPLALLHHLPLLSQNLRLERVGEPLSQQLGPGVAFGLRSEGSDPSRIDLEFLA